LESSGGLSRVKKRAVKVVGIGGGTGLATLLAGLKNAIEEISAIVTVTDDGGSSGKIRKEFNIPPPGDIRNCLVALANTEPLMAKLFQYRFPGAKDFHGHPFGNLFIMAMTRITGSFEEGVRQASKILQVHGQVIPSTLRNVVLGAEFYNGEKVFGQTKIVKKRKRIKRIFLKPAQPPAGPNVINTIKEADVIILGPGSLYTSILPNLLVRGVSQAIADADALKIYVSNVMTQPGETEGYSVSDHMKAILDYLPGNIDYVLVNSDQAPRNLEERYARKGSYPVLVDKDNLRKMDVKVVGKKMVRRQFFAKHDPAKLTEAILELIEKGKKERRTKPVHH